MLALIAVGSSLDKGGYREIQAVIAKVHIVAYKECGHTKCASRNGLVSIGFQLSLGLWQCNPCKKSVCRHIGLKANARQHIVLRNIFLPRKVRGKCSFYKLQQF